jgi:hypothetical protein
MEIKEKQWKHGEIHPDTGMAFWGYQKKVERWMDAKKFNLKKETYKERDKQRKRKNREKNPEKYRQQNKESYQRHSEKRKQGTKLYRQKNIQECKERDAKYAPIWKAKNKERYNQYQREWCKRNREKRGVIESHRIALEKVRLHPDHNRKIEECLRSANKRLKNCLGFQWDVDHILPITKKGWHHHCNMQMLPHSLNVRKRNNPNYPLPDCYKKHID